MEADEEDDVAQAKKPWWAVWRKASSRNQSDFVTPEEWLRTDLGTGLVDAEVERRRKFSGWNELFEEKDNWAKTFASYFQGPILYGEPRAWFVVRPRTGY